MISQADIDAVVAILDGQLRREERLVLGQQQLVLYRAWLRDLGHPHWAECQTYQGRDIWVADPGRRAGQGRRRLSTEGVRPRGWEEAERFSLDFEGVLRPGGREPATTGWWKARWRAWFLARATGKVVIIRAHRGMSSWVVRRVKP